uniref:hypothetical protein n=1 Tax=Serratia fonticola TaxID=47917 RepID=UPI00301C79BE
RQPLRVGAKATQADGTVVSCDANPGNPNRQIVTLNPIAVVNPLLHYPRDVESFGIHQIPDGHNFYQSVVNIYLRSARKGPGAIPFVQFEVFGGYLSDPLPRHFHAYAWNLGASWGDATVYYIWTPSTTSQPQSVAGLSRHNVAGPLPEFGPIPITANDVSNAITLTIVRDRPGNAQFYKDNYPGPADGSAKKGYFGCWLRATDIYGNYGEFTPTTRNVGEEEFQWRDGRY